MRIDDSRTGKTPELVQLRAKEPRGKRALTLSLRRVTHDQRERIRSLAAGYPEGIERPRTRGDCQSGGMNSIRPCPFVSCSMHLYIDVDPRGGLKLNFPEQEVDEIPETCALDVADRGGAILEEVAQCLQVTRERIRQIEDKVRRKLCTRVDLPLRKEIVDQ